MQKIIWLIIFCNSNSKNIIFKFYFDISLTIYLVYRITPTDIDWWKWNQT